MPIQKSGAKVLQAETLLQSKSSLQGWALECHKHRETHTREESPQVRSCRFPGLWSWLKAQMDPIPSCPDIRVLINFQCPGCCEETFSQLLPWVEDNPKEPQSILCTFLWSSCRVWPLRDPPRAARVAQTPQNPSMEVYLWDLHKSAFVGLLFLGECPGASSLRELGFSRALSSLSPAPSYPILCF